MMASPNQHRRLTAPGSLHHRAWGYTITLNPHIMEPAALRLGDWAACAAAPAAAPAGALASPPCSSAPHPSAEAITLEHSAMTLGLPRLRVHSG